jgi:hypothetical protein
MGRRDLVSSDSDQAPFIWLGDLELPTFSLQKASCRRKLYVLILYGIYFFGHFDTNKIHVTSEARQKDWNAPVAVGAGNCARLLSSERGI